ncbi:3-oxoadipate enol-lactonase [Salipiger bermudensis]|uniref:3-oxoadipate enol-lactone hydrolase n=1 Tax=Salipiger bermudensis (strain DSM 26914 / JCM 13377 / KCTC 12554 / HTCC2601) TaxID=314265 RepID=Q0FK07_SALBH|nr:3-oxoadipate enol-lactonase [Salipiger bermudensis]EAU44519.1 3-oxoadipate enol-lactone hydrolase [Salipiger bermudensis HTCC2601]
MQMADLGDIRLHYRIDGPEDGAPVVFSNALGTDLRIWDRVVARLPEGLRILRYDTRGHGLSDAPEGPYSMGTLVRDTERLMAHVEMQDAVVVGLSIGGMIAQGLAAKRLDLVRALVLSNTACKIGTRAIWAERIAQVEAGGVAALAEGTMQRWFSARFRATPESAAWRHMLERSPVQGYLGCCHAIAGTDFITPTSGLRLAALGIASSEDGSTPPDLVRETTELIPGAQFRLIRGAGHIACVEAADVYAAVLSEFLAAQGHL